MSGLYTAIAIAGSLIVSCSTLPQIFLVHKRGSTGDISFLYQFVLMAGTLMSLVYYSFYAVWAMFFPILLSFFFILYLIVFKVRLEHFQKRRRDQEVEAVSSGLPETAGVGLEGGAVVPEREVGGTLSAEMTTPMMSAW